MKHKFLFILIACLFVADVFAQYTDDSHFVKEIPLKRQRKITNEGLVKSTDGYLCSPHGTYRALSIFVNIIYDQTPADTIRRYSNPGTYWKPDTTFSINMYPPAYFIQLFDTQVKTSYLANISRFYSECSLGELHMLSDQMVVNIRQSQITPLHPGANFTLFNLMDAVAEQINKNGGLNTIYGYNSIDSYDRSSFAGLTSDRPDGKIDMIHFVLRNTFITNTGINFGNVNPGAGYSGEGIYPEIPLKIGNTYYDYNLGTYQCVGGGTLTTSTRTIWGHEIAHYFLGGNEFHTSGANHTGDYVFMPSTFIGIQRGYGIFEGGLSSCNGYERWRLGWQGPTNNAFPIAANNQNSDLGKFEGEKTFTLRDFVTYGDAIRIKMPYKDRSESSNQYIWLENHQCGKNGKIDDLNYSFPGSCRDVTKAGIYSYYQVGKDILESPYDSIVFPKNEKDNLRIISSEGNHDVIFKGRVNDCMGYCGASNCRPQYEYVTENPFSGINDQTEVFPVNTFTTKINFSSGNQLVGSKIKNGILYNNLPWLGDNFDAFVPTSEGTSMDISTNPAAVNTTTYYSIQNTRVGDSLTFKAVDSLRNTRKIYLTGLSIRMIDPNPAENGMKTYTVKIRWDDYDLKRDVIWKGDIVLNEMLNILPGKTVRLEQSRSANQIPFDTASGCFARTTFFTSKPGSVLNMQESSAFELKEKSSLVLENNATFTIQNGAILTVEPGSTMLVRHGANLTLSGNGKILIKAGAYYCAQPGSNITLTGDDCKIEFEEGAIKGVHPALFPDTECLQ